MLVLLAGCGGGGEQGERTERFFVDSRLVGERLEQDVVIPPGETKGRPILLFLHGRGMTPDDMATVELRDAVRRLGDKAPIVILVNGGDHSYFHDRRDGAWGSYVIGEVLPAVVRRYRADPKRVAIGGFSMGGFGALDLARAAPGLFCAVGGHDAALWFRASQTPEGAFDDAEDFHRHDILAAAQANPGLFGQARVWLDAGETDHFRRSTTALSRTLEGEVFHIWPGSTRSSTSGCIRRSTSTSMRRRSRTVSPRAT